MHGPQVQRDTDELEINLNRWLLRKLTRRYRSQRTDPHNPNIAQLNGRRKLIICSRHQDHSVHNSGCHRVVICGLLLFVSWTSFAQAPSAYQAYTGTDPKPIPPAPSLGPANWVFNDPTFGSRILRVTDQNTNGGDSYIPEDAGFFRTWNADS